MSAQPLSITNISQDDLNTILQRYRRIRHTTSEVQFRNSIPSAKGLFNNAANMIDQHFDDANAALVMSSVISVHQEACQTADQGRKEVQRQIHVLEVLGCVLQTSASALASASITPSSGIVAVRTKYEYVNAWNSIS
ncbi:hypothetical protein BGZ47_008854 [Haplosporangium gracile]|nr:hypothetical protein BGZ47_008854 [Haplosporangium gracile]